MPVLVCIRRFVTSGQRLRCGFWSRERERERERRSLLVGSGSMVNFYCRCQQQVSNTFSWGIPSAPEEVGGVWWAICLPKSLAIATCTHNWSRAVGSWHTRLSSLQSTKNSTSRQTICSFTSMEIRGGSPLCDTCVAHAALQDSRRSLQTEGVRRPCS